MASTTQLYHSFPQQRLLGEGKENGRWRQIKLGWLVDKEGGEGERLWELSGKEKRKSQGKENYYPLQLLGGPQLAFSNVQQLQRMKWQAVHSVFL